jgi:23S rRNA pseudouridine1911/1915/1917 synthase
MDQTFVIEAPDVDKRLDVFLTEHFAGVSRTRIQKAVKAKEVTVNGKNVTPHLALRINDKVEVLADISPADPNAPLLPRPDIKLEIIHQDDDVVVIDKPSGLLVHPDVAEETQSVANAFIALFPEAADVGENRQRPGIMHRLDKEASGLLVLARNAKAYELLKEQFKTHTVEKVYHVLVAGKPLKDEGTITFPIGRMKGSGRMAAHSDLQEGDRDATTHYVTLEKFTGATLLEVRTETGRTHQIRVHLKAIGYPVAGDPLYGNEAAKDLPTKRLFLHAAALGFTHPTSGERVRFTRPLPAELERTLNKLRKQE